MTSNQPSSVTTVYKGHALRIGTWNGKLSGRVHYLGQRLLSLEGADEQQLLAQLKEAVDRGLPDKDKAVAKLMHKHASFMERMGLAGGRVEPIHRVPVTPHCWNCKQPFDGSVEYGHTTCKWIICTSCGACGCAS